ncbi:hypothetical protein HS7_12020 [Sulfolobales archaeon HS-7]|nr:hypothetical protein HS7_12020 [Sulfolobales archaeon HS-7]
MRVRIKNIGGLSSLDVKIDKGLTLYKAPNSYGKTSLVRALISLLTSEVKAEDLLNVSEDEGLIELHLDDDTYFRKIARRGRRIMEEKKLLMDDRRALYLSFFSPENKIVNQITTGNEDIEWFLSETSQINALAAKRNELEQYLSSLEKKQGELMRKYKESSQAIDKIKEIELEMEKIQNDIKMSQVANNTNVALLVTKTNKIEDLKQKINARKEELENTRKVFERYKAKENEITQKIDYKYKETLKQKLSDLVQRIESKSQLIREVEANVSFLKKILEGVQDAQRKHLETCYLCGTNVNPEHWNARITEISSEITKANSSISAIRMELDQLQREKEDAEQQMSAIEKVENELEIVRSKAKEIEKKMELIQSDIDNLERQLREAEGVMRSSIMFATTRTSELNRKLEELAKKKAEVEDELLENGTPASLMDEIHELDEEIRSVRKRVEEITNEYVNRITSVRENFNREIERLTASMGFDFHAEINERFKIVVRRKNVTLDLRKLSSSERVTIALVVVVAAMKSYFKTPFFIVDEMFMTYDQKRWDAILSYIITLAPYVIVTRSEERPSITSVSSEPQEEIYQQ